MIPTSINNVLEKAKSERDSAVIHIAQKRPILVMDNDTFSKLIILKCERIFIDRNEPKKFILTDSNKKLINYLHLFSTANKDFPGSIYKGIHIWGDFGTGKTTLMMAFREIIMENTGKNITMILAKNLGSNILEKTMNHYVRMPLFLDDIGREMKEIKDFGNIYKPVPDLYYLRKEHGSWTFQTCQKAIDDLEPLYGLFITSRMHAMFNEFHLEGKCMR
ncbi:MAG: hypothetical protein PHX80_05310 [Candidatus Nanoarchaeia archaeon]|nr:hypothetical protein [Candidatus Nanoarchaeia archaeon]